MSDNSGQLIAGNWKMNHTLSQGLKFMDELLAGLAGGGLPFLRRLLLAPNFTLLPAFAEPCARHGILLAAQNCAGEEGGAFTGETSVAMLKDVGADCVIIGHSERRQIFAEDDALLARKLKLAVAAGLTPIFCVGENLEQRQAGSARAVVLRQLELGLADYAGPLTIAYEPVWAIGTGRTATPADAREMHLAIRNFLSRRFADGAEMPILYGGSAKPENAAALLAEAEVGGLLVGGASLKAESLLAIARAGA